MKNILDLISKYAVFLLIGLTAMNGCNSCSHTKEASKLRREVDSLNVSLNTFKNSVYNKEQLDLRMSVEGFEISKRMLYDQNAIVRTTVRPDDMMNEYDTKIKELQEKISKSK